MSTHIETLILLNILRQTTTLETCFKLINVCNLHSFSSFHFLSSSWWKFSSPLWHFVATASDSESEEFQVISSPVACMHYAAEVFAAKIFYFTQTGSALSNRQSPVLMKGLDNGYSVFQYIVDTAGNFFQYIDMKKIFQWQPYAQRSWDHHCQLESLQTIFQLFATRLTTWFSA